MSEWLVNGILIIVALFFLWLVYYMGRNAYQIIFKHAVPWVRTPRQITKAMLELAEAKEGEKFVDLGAGEGSMVIDAMRDFGLIGSGVELRWPLVLIGRMKARMLGVKGMKLMQGSYYEVFPEADIIGTYLLADITERIEPLLKKHYPSGTRVISRGFPYPTLPLQAKTMHKNETLYLYIIP